MKKLIPLLLLLGIVCGCHSGQNDTATSQTGKTRQDSLALKVALMPTLDCLPFYYAQRCGLFKELGLDIRKLSMPKWTVIRLSPADTWTCPTRI